ncbi:hypothetical protein [Micromonospora sp. NPDC005197]|uniref:hypothetical protein n=1 Tax=Micromonospora sp. NPDC005197 TaxID=3157020 RepID=UPI0033B2CCBA
MVGPITAGSRCFDPFCRTGELLVEVNRVAGEGGAVPVVVRGSHPEPAFVELAEMNLSMHGRVPSCRGRSRLHPRCLSVTGSTSWYRIRLSARWRKPT